MVCYSCGETSDPGPKHGCCSLPSPFEPGGRPLRALFLSWVKEGVQANVLGAQSHNAGDVTRVLNPLHIVHVRQGRPLPPIPKHFLAGVLASPLPCSSPPQRPRLLGQGTRGGSVVDIRAPLHLGLHNLSCRAPQPATSFVHACVGIVRMHGCVRASDSLTWQGCKVRIST